MNKNKNYNPLTIDYLKIKIYDKNLKILTIRHKNALKKNRLYKKAAGTSAAYKPILI